LSRLLGLHETRVSEARTILDYAPDLADVVIFGIMRLDPAYDEARQRAGVAPARARVG
jgi:hypothetical protein